MSREFNVPLRVLFYREDDAVIAHCLEFDLIGDGETHEEAMQSLADAIAVQIAEVLESKNVDNLFHPAPGEYFRMFAEGHSDERIGKAVGMLQIHEEPIDVTEVVGREYLQNGNRDGELTLV